MHCHSRGSGDAVLFIHGIPTSNHLWDGVIDRLSASYQCIAVDLPGLGRSPHDAQRLGELGALAERFEQLRSAHQIHKWHIVGHDAGCAIAVHYAHRFPDRVGRLALLSPALFPDLKPFWMFRLLRTPLLGEVMAPAVNLAFWRVAMRFATEGRREELADIVGAFRAPFSGPRGAWRLMSLVRFGETREVLAGVPGLLSELAMPTMVFQGIHDRALPESFARRAAALIPDCKMIAVDAGHFIPLNNPWSVATELLQFFEPASTAAQFQKA